MGIGDGVAVGLIAGYLGFITRRYVNLGYGVGNLDTLVGIVQIGERVGPLVGCVQFHGIPHRNLHKQHLDLQLH